MRGWSVPPALLDRIPAGADDDTPEEVEAAASQHPVAPASGSFTPPKS